MKSNTEEAAQVWKELPALFSMMDNNFCWRKKLPFASEDISSLFETPWGATQREIEIQLEGETVMLNVSESKSSVKNTSTGKNKHHLGLILSVKTGGAEK